MTRVHVVIPTHTTRHLATTLCALAASENPPATVVVAVDGDDPGFIKLVESISFASETTAVVVARAHQGQPRLNQVRNNGLRALKHLNRIQPHDLVLMIDGDMALARDAIGMHLAAAKTGADLVLASRANLSEPETDALTSLIVSDSGTSADELMKSLWADSAPKLANRQRRTDRQARLRAVPLVGRLIVKGHKPKILGGHHALRWALLETVNGYDERFVEYGYDDDDLARRVHAAGARTAVRIDSIAAFHLWHPTRAPTRPVDAPGYSTFTQPWKPRADSGIVDGANQPEPEINIVGEARPGE
jgi:glycosyl transferase family 7 (putative galactosyltransferase)